MKQEREYRYVWGLTPLALTEEANSWARMGWAVQGSPVVYFGSANSAQLMFGALMVLDPDRQQALETLETVSAAMKVLEQEKAEVMRVFEKLKADIEKASPFVLPRTSEN